MTSSRDAIMDEMLVLILISNVVTWFLILHGVSQQKYCVSTSQEAVNEPRCHFLLLFGFS